MEPSDASPKKNTPEVGLNIVFVVIAVLRDIPSPEEGGSGMGRAASAAMHMFLHVAKDSQDSLAACTATSPSHTQ